MKRNKSKPIKVKEAANLRAFKSVREIDLILYWSTLLVLIMANFFMAIIVIPFLFFTSNLYFYLLIAVLAIFFGYVFGLLLGNIENLDVHHNLIAVFFIPVFAVINLIIISISINRIAGTLGMHLAKNPLTISIFYAVFFFIPYFILTLRKRL